ncbi:MAG: XisI protein [Pleurocapsa sp. SU_196_0]|nr:XisI protein [Pleurocapsa sp. SU_196_0]
MSDAQIAQQILREWKDYGYRDDGVLVFDDENGRYLLLSVGWDGQKRFHYVAVHLHLKDGKFFIEWDNTPEGVALDLERVGVPKNRIVLAFYPLEHRRHGDYAPQ